MNPIFRPIIDKMRSKTSTELATWHLYNDFVWPCYNLFKVHPSQRLIVLQESKISIQETLDAVKETGQSR